MRLTAPRQGCRGWAGPRRLGVLGACAGCLCSPSRSLSICPLPASCFCFGATGTSSSHHSSKWLAGLSGKPVVGGWSSQPKGHPQREGQGASVAWEGRAHWDARGPSHNAPAAAPYKASQLLSWSLWGEHHSRPRGLGPAAGTLSSRSVLFLPQTEDPEELLPSLSSLAHVHSRMDTHTYTVAHTGTYSHNSTHTGAHSHSTHTGSGALAWPEESPVCTYLGECVWGSCGMYTCVCECACLSGRAWVCVFLGESSLSL